MKQATHTLREEHHWIRLLLDCLEGLVENYRTSGEFDTKAAGELQQLLEHFVDKQHQEKEEAALFPRLLECVRRLQEDHAEERIHLERMRFSLFNAALGDPASRSAFGDEARAYIELQREHIARENQGLLPLAEQLLTDEEDLQVLEDFARAVPDYPEREDVRLSVRRLCSRLQVPFEMQPIG